MSFLFIIVFFFFSLLHPSTFLLEDSPLLLGDPFPKLLSLSLETVLQLQQPRLNALYPLRGKRLSS